MICAGSVTFSSLVAFSQQESIRHNEVRSTSDSTAASGLSFQDDPASGSRLTSIVKDIFILTNQFRTSEQLPALINRKDLNAIAQKHSEDMASGRVEFGHDGFEERNNLVRKQIVSITNFAENVANGVNTGEQVVAMWKQSAGHRRNMLGHFTYIGIGAAKSSSGKIFYTQIFAGSL